MPESVQITPWFGGHSVTVIPLSEKVAYSWSVPGALTPAQRAEHVETIHDLIVWHDCDKHLWLADPTKNQSLVPDYIGWHPAGVAAHDLITVEPLHIEASVYWPDCCGMHGFIRNGTWVSA